jgi:hypothetical protein
VPAEAPAINIVVQHAGERCTYVPRRDDLGRGASAAALTSLTVWLNAADRYRKRNIDLDIDPMASAADVGVAQAMVGRGVEALKRVDRADHVRSQREEHCRGRRQK